MGNLERIKDVPTRQEIENLRAELSLLRGSLSSQSVVAQGRQIIAPSEDTGFVTDSELSLVDTKINAHIANTQIHQKPRVLVLGGVDGTNINSNESISVFPLVGAPALQMQYPRAGSLRSLSPRLYNGTLTSGSATVEFEIYAGSAGGTLLTEVTYSWTGNFVGDAGTTTTQYGTGIHTFDKDDLLLMFIRFTGTFVGNIDYIGMQAELEFDS